MQLATKKILVVTGIGLGLIGVFLIYFFYNPSSTSDSTFFLSCPLRTVTGFHCPGCGSQRALHQLFNLNFVNAFRLNPFMVLSLPIILYALGLRIYNYLYETHYRVWFFYKKWFIYGYFGLALIYWVLRNLPYYPFYLLAPTE